MTNLCNFGGGCQYTLMEFPSYYINVSYFLFRFGGEYVFMGYYIILLTSITYVNKAQYILSQNNIKSSIVKLQSSLERRGCGYGLEVRENFLRSAVNLINNHGVRIVEIEHAD